MTIAITGARGRLGRVIRGYLAGRGFRVLAFSRHADAGHEALGTLHEMIGHGGIDAILHLAWSLVRTGFHQKGPEGGEPLPFKRAG